MRLINADVLKQHIDKLPALPDGNFAGNHSALKALINMQPTVDAVPVVHGQWKMVEGELAFWNMCSVCGRKILHRTPYYDFCPNCGARMDGEDGDGNGTD